MGLYGATFAVPIFAQSILHFTAQQTGLLLLPGALASAVMFPVMGRIMGKLDARVLIAVGSVILAGTMYWMRAIMAPTTGPDDFFWPMIVRGLAVVAMYLPLTLATIGPIPRKDVSKATGIYSLMRQMGGSIGIALLTMLLTDRGAFLRNVLVEKLGMTSPTDRAGPGIAQMTFAMRVEGGRPDLRRPPRPGHARRRRLRPGLGAFVRRHLLRRRPDHHRDAAPDQQCSAQSKAIKAASRRTLRKATSTAEAGRARKKGLPVQGGEEKERRMGEKKSSTIPGPKGGKLNLLEGGSLPDKFLLLPLGSSTRRSGSHRSGAAFCLGCQQCLARARGRPLCGWERLLR